MLFKKVYYVVCDNVTHSVPKYSWIIEQKKIIFQNFCL